MGRKRTKSAVYKLAPNVRYLATNLLSRCETVWLKLFESLYKLELTAEYVPEIVWSLDVKTGRVLVALTAAPDYEETDLWETAPAVEFQIDLAEPAPAKLKPWLQSNIVTAFESEAVSIEYSYFDDGNPFSILLKLGTASKSLCIWSNVRKVAKPKPFKPSNSKRRNPSKQVDYGNESWRRFYFDDGTKRQYWYVRCQGRMQSIAQGKTGSSARISTKSFPSPKSASEATGAAIKKKLATGFFEYDYDGFKYRVKNRCAKPLVKKAIAAFEFRHELQIAPEFRRHLLEVNGGSLHADQAISVPGRGMKKLEVFNILGFVNTGFASDIDYCSAQFHLPDGYMLLAGITDEYLVLDQLGCVRMFDLTMLDPRDQGDDNTLYLDHLPSYVVAQSFDELLTRLRKFPNDIVGLTNQKVDLKPASIKTLEHIEKAKVAALNQKVRRFYFDDGQLQKYWYIEREESCFTTSYNRYGIPPARTTTTFATEAAAEVAKEKIIGQKVKKGYVEVVPDSLQLKRQPSTLRVATEKAVSKFESDIGFDLPEEYRTFLRTRNGGEPTPGFIELKGVPHIANVKVDYVLGLYSRPAAGKDIRLEKDRYALPVGHLPIAKGIDLASVDLFTLSLQWKHGCVFYWESDSPLDGKGRLRNRDAHIVAHCFDEFLTKLALPGAE